MVCDKCGVDLPESMFWDDICTMCHSEDRIKQLEEENERLQTAYDKAMDLVKAYNKKETLEGK